MQVPDGKIWFPIIAGVFIAIASWSLMNSIDAKMKVAVLEAQYSSIEKKLDHLVELFDARMELK
jgi:hypothetical protein